MTLPVAYQVPYHIPPLDIASRSSRTCWMVPAEESPCLGLIWGPKAGHEAAVVPSIAGVELTNSGHQAASVDWATWVRSWGGLRIVASRQAAGRQASNQMVQNPRSHLRRSRQAPSLCHPSKHDIWNRTRGDLQPNQSPHCWRQTSQLPNEKVSKSHGQWGQG